MIDVAKERLCSLPEAANHLPGRPHISTVIRWVQKGVRGVRLEVAKFGRKTVTSYEALTRFGAALAEAESQPNQHTARKRRKRSPREQQIAAAESFCDARGV